MTPWPRNRHSRTRRDAVQPGGRGSVTAATRRELAKRRGTLMDKAILLAVAASVCTATASLCQRKGAKDNETAGFSTPGS